MEINFSVPVDCPRLAALRKAAGFKSQKGFEDYLHSLGYTFAYHKQVERPHYGKMRGQCHPADGPNWIKGSTAAAIAQALGLEPDEVFPEYSARKAAAELNIAENYYKPFTTIKDRNVAIVGCMAAAEKTANTLSRLTCDGVPIGRDEAVSCAYEILVECANVAMLKGIPKNTTFLQYACGAIKLEIIERYHGAKTSAKRKYEFCSLSVFSHDYVRDLNSLNPEELYILREELEERRTAENCRHKNGGKSRT